MIGAISPLSNRADIFPLISPVSTGFTTFRAGNPEGATPTVRSMK